jgi:hypothetical protein
MRSHGLADFPDPLPGGGLQFNLGPGLDPQSPAFQSAQDACQHVVPGPPMSPGGPSDSQRAAALKYAQCMRTHGVPNYPDPTYDDGRPTQEPLSNYGIDPQSPPFADASRSCKAA